MFQELSVHTFLSVSSHTRQAKLLRHATPYHAFLSDLVLKLVLIKFKTLLNKIQNNLIKTLTLASSVFFKRKNQAWFGTKKTWNIEVV